MAHRMEKTRLRIDTMLSGNEGAFPPKRNPAGRGASVRMIRYGKSAWGSFRIVPGPLIVASISRIL